MQLGRWNAVSQIFWLYNFLAKRWRKQSNRRDRPIQRLGFWRGWQAGVAIFCVSSLAPSLPSEYRREYLLLTKNQSTIRASFRRHWPRRIYWSFVAIRPLHHLGRRDGCRAVPVRCGAVHPAPTDNPLNLLNPSVRRKNGRAVGVSVKRVGDCEEKRNVGRMDEINVEMSYARSLSVGVRRNNGALSTASRCRVYDLSICRQRVTYDSPCSPPEGNNFSIFTSAPRFFCIWMVWVHLWDLENWCVFYLRGSVDVIGWK